MHGGRNLSYYSNSGYYTNSGYQYYYWDRTAAYRASHPENCYKYCDWYPQYCNAFCERFPQFCVPPEVTAHYSFIDLLIKLEIYSLYGPNWASQVEQICWKVDAMTCKTL